MPKDKDIAEKISTFDFQMDNIDNAREMLGFPVSML